MGFLMKHSVPRQGDAFFWKSRAEEQGWFFWGCLGEKHQRAPPGWIW